MMAAVSRCTSRYTITCGLPCVAPEHTHTHTHAQAGKQDGLGVLSLPDGSLFDAQWVAGKRHGVCLYRPPDRCLMPNRSQANVPAVPATASSGAAHPHGASFNRKSLTEVLDGSSAIGSVTGAKARPPSYVLAG